jgi:hypothetical protein
MKYRVEGADAQTGAPRTMTVDAGSESQARDIAQREGMFISRVVLLDGDALDRATEQAGKAVGRVLHATPAAIDPQQHGEARRTRQQVKAEQRQTTVALGTHVQGVRLTGSSEFSLVVVIALGVFLGLLAFICCGGGLMLSGLARGLAEGAAP